MLKASYELEIGGTVGDKFFFFSSSFSNFDNYLSGSSSGHLKIVCLSETLIPHIFVSKLAYKHVYNFTYTHKKRFIESMVITGDFLRTMPMTLKWIQEGGKQIRKVINPCLVEFWLESCQILYHPT